MQVARHLHRNLPAKAWREVADPRDRRGRRFALTELLQGLMLGMVTGAVTLRDVELLLHDVVYRRQLGLRGTPSDTTLERVIRLLAVGPLLGVLQHAVRGMHRSKQLEVLPDIGISLVAVDGKAIATDPARLHPMAQCQDSENAGRYVLRVLRAVHTSSAVKPIIGQLVVPPDAGEVDTFPPFMEQLLDAYGQSGLIECVTLDAGFTSRSNLQWLNERDLGFIAALKGNQPSLHEAVCRELGAGESLPRGGWEHAVEQVRGSRQVKLYFARTRHELVLADWPCIRQVWRIRQRVEQGGEVTWEDRYFVTNLPWGRLRPQQCLNAVRAHWGIENEANWTMDAIWKEDTRAWVRQDMALEVLAVLRCIAYNVIRLLRHRTFRSEDNRALAYRRLLQLARMALTATALDPAVGFS